LQGETYGCARYPHAAPRPVPDCASRDA